MHRAWLAAALGFATVCCASPLTAATMTPGANSQTPHPAGNPLAKQFVVDAKKAIKARNSKLAILLLKNALKISPHDGEARALLGWTMLQYDDAPSAERELRQARIDGADEQFVLATLFDTMLARHEEKRLLIEFPEPSSGAHDKIAADILRGRALALQALGRADDASKAMERSLSLRRDVSGLLTRAQIAAQQNNSALAMRLTDEALKREPNSGRALLAKLNQLRASNDTVGALALSEKILRLFPNNIPATLTRIDIFLKLNQDRKAKAEVDALLAKLPRALNVVYYRALIMARANDKRGAWRVAQTLPPDFVRDRPALAIQVSQMAVKVGNVELGGAILASALAKSPNELDLRLRLAELRLQQNSPQAALGVLMPIRDSHDPRALSLLAEVYQALGKRKEAGFALDALSSIDLQKKDPKAALEVQMRARSLAPGEGQITYHLVLALDANGDRNAAKSLLKELLNSGVAFDDLPKARQLAAAWH